MKSAGFRFNVASEKEAGVFALVVVEEEEEEEEEAGSYQVGPSFMQVPFPIPLEVNVVLVGFLGDGGYRFQLDGNMLQEHLKKTFPSHRPACLETGALLEIEHQLTYNVIPVRQSLRL